MLIFDSLRWLGRATSTAVVLLVALAGCPGLARASGPVGLEVLVQAWNPADPLRTEHPTSAFKNAGLFSDTIGRAWEAARGPVCDAMKQELGKADLVKAGYTLYDTTCTMGHIDSLTLGQKKFGSKDIQLNLVIGGNSFEATSTQPSVCGSTCDARASVRYTVTLAADLQLYPLALVGGSIAVSQVQLDPHNAVAAVAAELDSFFLNGRYKTMAEHALSITKAFPVQLINSQLAAVQNPLRPYVATYLSIGTWVRNGLLTVDFAPAPLPNPSGGSISGLITWAKDAPVKLIDCNSFSLAGRWQNGPAPLESPPDGLGAEPIAAVGQVGMQLVVDRGDHYECPYTMSNLPLHLPTHVDGAVQAGKGADTKNAYMLTVVALEPTAWAGNVTPNASGSGFDFKVVTHTVQSKPLGNVKEIAKNTGDPAKSSALQTAVQQKVAAPATAPAAVRVVRAGAVVR